MKVISAAFRVVPLFFKTRLTVIMDPHGVVISISFGLRGRFPLDVHFAHDLSESTVSIV